MFEIFVTSTILLTYIVIVPLVDGIVVIAGDGSDGWNWHCRMCVGSHMSDRRVGQELHDHAHIILGLGEHHWTLGDDSKRRCLIKLFKKMQQ